MSISSRAGRKVGGQCRSKILNVRTGPRRSFPDAAEVAQRAEAKHRQAATLLAVRPKAIAVWTVRDGHRVVDVRRQPEVLQLLKACR
jgi:hypothetical protein